MGNFIMGFVLACAVMNPGATKNMLSKGVDMAHGVYVHVIKASN